MKWIYRLAFAWELIMEYPYNLTIWPQILFMRYALKEPVDEGYYWAYKVTRIVFVQELFNVLALLLIVLLAHQARAAGLFLASHPFRDRASRSWGRMSRVKFVQGLLGLLHITN